MQECSENTTLSLFIFRSNIRGMQYGIGTYIDELTQALNKFPEIIIYIVSYKSFENKEFFVIKKSTRIFEIVIPKVLVSTENDDSYNKRYANSVVKLITGFIPKEGNVIFQFNCLDDLPIILRLRERYMYPRINTVHYAQWQLIFGSNKAKMDEFNTDKPFNHIESSLSREREMYRQSDHIVSVTDYMREFLIWEYKIKEDRISVIKNGLNHICHGRISEGEKAEIRKNFGFREDELIILFSGRIDPCKGVLFLIEAFERACRKNNSLRLVMLGQGSVQDCQKKMKSAFGKVTFTGFLPKETVTQFYKIADIGISPSVYDHCPYSVLEMMANRIPLIMSRINGLNELLSDNECLFIDPVISDEGDVTFTVEEMSELILALASDKDLRIRLAENSFRTFERRFTSAAMAEEMHNLFYSLINQYKSVTEYETNQRR